MLLSKVAPVFLLALVVGAEKKIELADIEEDNLKSEQENKIDKPEARAQSSGPGQLPFEFLKNGLLRYFEGPTAAPQQPRFVQQYAVTETPERSSGPQPNSQYGAPTAQQAMVGYLSNVPMQIYLVPQYFNEHTEQASGSQGVQYTAPAAQRVPSYPSAPETVQPQYNYVEVPTYVGPTGKTYIQPYSTPVAYVGYATQPTVAPTQATTQVLAYPVVQYATALAAPPSLKENDYHSKQFYQNQQYTGTNAVEEVAEQNDIESQKEYAGPHNSPYAQPSGPGYHRYYPSRNLIRDDIRHSTVSELPPPNPLLLKGPPSHLSHIPKTLPMYRPHSYPKSPYASVGGFTPSNYSPRPSESYNIPYRRRPNSLLDSYIPSSVQVEYLKRGYAKDPLSAYEALSSGRHYPHPRHYERGFLPNTMYHTAAGGVTYGHYKRTPKIEKVQQK